MPQRAPQEILEIAQRPGRRIMQDIPELPGKVLRRMNVGYAASELALSPARYVGIAEDHLHWLRDAGLGVPEFTFYMGKRNIWSRIPGAHAWADPHTRRRMPMAPLFTVVDAITCSGEETGGFAWLYNPKVRPYAIETADALSNYHDWASKQKYFLWDVSEPRQYGFGTPVCHPEAGEQLFLLDLDPNLDRAGITRTPNPTLWQRSLSGSEQWQALKTS